MKTLFLLLIGALPQAASPSAAPLPDTATTNEVAFEGTLAEGLAEIEQLTAEGEVEPAIAISEALLAPNDFTRWRRELVAEESKVVAPALELVDPLLERLGLNGYAEPLRAEVMYARGCVWLAAEEREAAEEEFADARATSGPGELRLVASYNRGTTALLEGEVWRAQIPEVSGQPAPPAPSAPGAAGMLPMPGLPGAGAPPGEEAPDPLEVAREHYERAKEGLVERLRQDWRDADTRANVELVQRRLKELDEIERQREEQEQEQDEQQEDQEQQDDSEQQESEDESQQDESDQEQEQEQEQPPESEGEEPEPEEDEEQESEEESEETQDPEEAQPEEAQPQEVYLTREEVQRLLDRLREHEEEAEALRARLYQQSRRRVERDW